MEHLFHVNESRPIVFIPLYEDSEDLLAYDNDNLASKGWDKARLLSHGDLQGHEPSQVAAMFQSWLYFGFLARFFESLPHFQLNDFIRVTVGHKRIITTSRLKHWIMEWFTNCTQNMTVRHAQSEYYDKLSALFRRIYDAASLFCTCGRSYPQNGPVYQGVPEELSLSILVLFTALEKAATEFTARRFDYDIGTSHLILQRLYRDGWCRKEVEVLASKNLDTLYSAATLQRPRPDLDHQTCTPYLCLAVQVPDPTKYKQTHLPECSACEDCFLDTEEVASVALEDAVVLVHFDPGQRKLVTQSYKPRTQAAPVYVALSHIWSDGLGNPVANSLPSCQIRRIQSMVTATFGAHAKTLPLWWCDTLCVPVGSTYRPARRRAIGMMKDIYAKAGAVLVLDSALSQSSRDVSAIEVYLRLLTSSWMRRLWTFQEGIVASTILVQFRDGLASLSALYKSMLNIPRTSPIVWCTWYDNDCIEVLKPFEEGLGMEQDKATAVLRAVSSRSTSWRSDETICLGNVLGLDINPILDIDEEDCEGRIRCLLHTMQHLPPVLLFQQLPRLSQSGYRWAPRSFLSCFRETPTSLIYYNKPYMDMSTVGTGIKVQLPGISLCSPGHDPLKVGHHFGINVPLKPDSVACFIVYYAPKEQENEKNYSEEYLHLKSPMIVLYHDLSSEAFETFDRGALVNRTNEAGSHSVAVDYVALIGLRRVPQTVFSAQSRKSLFFRVIDGCCLAEETNWVVS